MNEFSCQIVKGDNINYTLFGKIREFERLAITVSDREEIER